VRVLTTLASQGVSACILNLPRHFIHRPLELTLELTNCCARARDVCVPVGECLHFEPSVTFHPSPLWTLTSLSRLAQGGGVLVDGVANFEGCNIHDNTAYVCLHLELPLNFHPSPR